MTHFGTQSLAAFAAILIAFSSIGAIVTVPPAQANAHGQVHSAMPELA